MRASLIFSVLVFSNLVFADNHANSICDEVDTRELSNDKFAARTMGSRRDGGPCSASLIANNCMVSVGHCLNTFKTVEFNTPASKNGEMVKSKPEDRYKVIQSSIKYRNRGPGLDWAVFKVKPNSITGLYPEQAQGGYLEIAEQVPEVGVEISIIGYGLDVESEKNNAQQISYGPLIAIGNPTVNSLLIYRSDTTGGNSGSGIRNTETNELLGIHGYGGCGTRTDYGNRGTSIVLHEEFSQAIRSCINSK